MAANCVLIKSHRTLSTVGSVTISGIPAIFKDLEVVYSARKTTSGVDAVVVTLNSTSATNGPYTDNGGGTPRTGTAGVGGIIQGTDYTNDTYSRNRLFIPNYTGNDIKRMSVDYVSENNATASYSGMSAITYNLTTAVTSITFTPATGNFVAGCDFQLYGYIDATQAPTAIPHATGGDIIGNDGTYWYHIFEKDGVFKPKKEVNCLVTAIGGGGGGSGGWVGVSWGPGGAGGIVTTLTTAVSTSQNVRIGAGGLAMLNATSSISYAGAPGGTTYFGTLLSATGGNGGTPPLTGGANATYTGGSGSSATSGGGAGAGGNGGNYSGSNGGAGGVGVQITTHTGTRYVAGGGGGGGAGSGGTGGSGGGGNGTNHGDETATPGSDYGAGGGGSGYQYSSRGHGFPGAVIVRYPMV